MRKGIYLLAFLVVIGLFLRGYHYLRNPSIWHDEAALLLNVVGKSYSEQMGPLYYAEAAPPLFLWIEKAISQGFGESNLALRLFPFLASCLAFLLLLVASRSYLTPRSLVWFALLFGCSDRLLWHCCEAKPYAIDVLIGSFLLFLCLRWNQTESEADPKSAQLSLLTLLLAGLTPLFIFLSFPACFMLGGLACILFPKVLKNAHVPSVLFSYSLFAIMLGGSFLALLLGPIHAQRNDHLVSGWLELFPHWHTPWLVPLEWLQRSTEVGRYCCEPVGNLFAPLALVGGISLWRKGKKNFVILLTMPIILCSVAWALQRYPMGPTRVMVFAAPAFLLLVAAGIVPTWDYLASKNKALCGVLVVLLLIPAGYSAYRLIIPWKRADTEPAIALIRSQRSQQEPIIGTAWEHYWYFRDIADYYKPLVEEAHAPEFQTPAVADLNALGDSCWVLQRSLGTPEELEAMDQILHGGRWQVARKYPFRELTVYQLLRQGRIGSAIAQRAERSITRSP